MPTMTVTDTVNTLRDDCGGVIETLGEVIVMLNGIVGSQPATENAKEVRASLEDETVVEQLQANLDYIKGQVWCIHQQVLRLRDAL